MRASRTPLDPGSHSVDRVTPKKTSAGWQVICSVSVPTLDPDTGEIVGVTSEIRRTRPTKGQARQAAREAAEIKIARGLEVIEEARTQVKKNRIDGMTVRDFIDTHCIPDLDRKGYADVTVRSYKDKLDLVLDRCGDPDCHHEHTIADMTLAQVTYGDGAGTLVKRCLEEIAPLHGTATAKKCVSVLRTWFYGPLDLWSHRFTSPLDSAKFMKQLNLAKVTKVAHAPAGVALTPDEYERAVTWFLALDPEEDTVMPRQGRYTQVNTAAEKRRNATTLTLLAAGTGARRSELLHVRWSEITETADGMVVHISHPKRTSTGEAIERDALVLDYRVEQHLRDLRDERNPDPGDYVAGRPTDASKVWEGQAVSKVIRTQRTGAPGLYDQCAVEAACPELARQAFHIWRRTVETRMIQAGVPLSARVTQLGHGGAVAEKHYVDHSQLSSLVTPARVDRPALRAVQ